MALLKLENLHVALEDGTEIVKGVDLEVDLNEVHAVMGPNGSGKSTLAYALMGHPEPFGPMTACTSFRSTSRSTPLTISVPSSSATCRFSNFSNAMSSA